MRLAIKIIIVAIIAKAVTLPLLFVLPQSGVEHKERYFINLYRKYPLAKAFGLQTRKSAPVTIAKPLYSLNSIKLKGIYSERGKGVIAIEEKGKIYLLATNESYKGYKLIKVEPDRAIFEKEGKIYRLFLSSDSSQKFSHIYTPHSSQPTQNFAIAKEEIDYYKKNLPKIWENISIQEIYDPKTKELSGFKVIRVKSDSLFGKLGLKKGDIIVGANGRKFHSLADVLKLYNEIDKYDSIKLTVIRNNQEKELEYALY